jgi:hypothetical protein
MFEAVNHGNEPFSERVLSLVAVRGKTSRPVRVTNVIGQFCFA